MSGISSEVIDLIKITSKKENEKYLKNILSIKNVSDFDAEFIMSRLSLNNFVIQLINAAAGEYEKRREIYKRSTYGDFLYRIVRNIEILEQNDISSMKELQDSNLNIKKFRIVLEFIINKAVDIENYNGNEKSENKFDFSKMNFLSC